MPWYFYLAFKQLFPTGRFPFFTLMSVLGVVLGVGVLVIVTSVMGGFQHELRKTIVQTEGEVQVKSSRPIEDVAGLLRAVQGTPVVAGATPFVSGPVMVLSAGHPAFPIFRGLDLETVNGVVNLQNFLHAGRLDDLDDDSIIISGQLAQELGAGLGATVEIVSPLVLEKFKADEVFLPRQFRVVGFFQIGHQHLDKSTVFGTLRAAQDLYGLGRAVHGVNVRLKPGVGDDEGAHVVSRALPSGTIAMPWTRSWEAFLWILNLEKTVFFFLLLFIVIIASFSVMTSLVASVVRKTREIGLLGALGGSRTEVALCFCVQAFFVGITGTALGVAFGFGVLAIRNEIVQGIAGALNRREALKDFYQFTNLPAHTDVFDLLAIVVTAIVLSTLAGLLPAWRAARLKPVEALRSE